MVKIQQRGLGRGLSALISENTASTASREGVESSEVSTDRVSGQTEIALSQLVPGKFQPRTIFNEQQLQELSDSIRKNGVMQPILVRKVSRAGSRDIYEIVAGERRWRAATMAELKTIPVIIRELTDQQALELALIENVQRADLNPLEEALGYQRLLEEFSYTQDELASTLGKSRSHIANLIRLLSLPDEIKAMLEKGDLNMGHARALLNAPDPIALAQNIVEKGLSVRQAEQMARVARGNSGSPSGRVSHTAARTVATALNKDPDILALEETVSQTLGLQVSINDRGQTGEVVISYTTMMELDEVLRKLGSSKL